MHLQLTAGELVATAKVAGTCAPAGRQGAFVMPGWSWHSLDQALSRPDQALGYRMRMEDLGDSTGTMGSGWHLYLYNRETKQMVIIPLEV